MKNNKTILPQSLATKTLTADFDESVKLNTTAEQGDVLEQLEQGDVLLGDIESEAPITAPAQEWALVRQGDGSEHPDNLSNDLEHNTINRSFAFLDIVGFTKYTRREGPAKALRLLDDFRSATRKIAAARGVRIAKWLGDGVLLVSVDAKPLIATCAHIIGFVNEIDVSIRVGIATGPVLLLDGDDYVGESINLASKLCTAAHEQEILANVKSDDLPEWVEIKKNIAVDIRGVGRIGKISVLGLLENPPNLTKPPA